VLKRTARKRREERERTKARKARAITPGVLLDEKKYRRDLSFSILDARQSVVSASATLPRRYRVGVHGKKAENFRDFIDAEPRLYMYMPFIGISSVRSLTHAADRPSPRASRIFPMYLRGNNWGEPWKNIACSLVDRATRELIRIYDEKIALTRCIRADRRFSVSIKCKKRAGDTETRESDLSLAFPGSV